MSRRCVSLIVASLGGLLFCAIGEARDPETLCATQDANRLMIKPGLGFFDTKTDRYTRQQNEERLASCELRANGRTIFQRYERGTIVQRGFFLQGKRSGRWVERGSVTIYVAGTVIQQAPSSECDPVAKIQAAITVYCPRTTKPRDMISDFQKWDAAMNLKVVVFDVYSNETKIPDSKASFDAVPEDSALNFAAAQFTAHRLTEFLCAPPGEKKQSSCMKFVDPR